MATDPEIEILIDRQLLRLKSGASVLREYAVSTAANGPGERNGSRCTPRGEHIVAEKIGAGCAVGTVFVAREPTGERFTPALRDQHPDRDWILTRILWLRGTQDGVNRGGDVDTFRRYIYIHGSPDDVAMGTPGSAGCIRMRSADVVDLFERVNEGTRVRILE